MNGKSGSEQGSCFDQELNSQRSGRMRSRVGTGGLCVCPQCGQREPHQRAMPCFEQKCPKCGATMTRE